jgi:hypothetical protein
MRAIHCFVNRPLARGTLALLVLVGMSGCTGGMVMLGAAVPPPPTATDLELGVAVVQPAAPTNAAVGVTTQVQWADIATIPGTTVRVSAQRQDATQGNVGDPIQLVGDGTPGSGRDALADGSADVFEWDITGVRVGDYVITVTVDSPDGQSVTAVSRDADRNTTGVITVTTALAAPTLSFTAPAAADVTLNPGDSFTITWTDNGSSNGDALQLLGLDPDADRNNGNEIVLLRDQPLSADGNNGQFLFVAVDENGNPVPPGTYTVFSRLDDNANDIVTVAATGRLILNP